MKCADLSDFFILFHCFTASKSSVQLLLWLKNIFITKTCIHFYTSENSNLEVIFLYQAQLYIDNETDHPDSSSLSIFLKFQSSMSNCLLDSNLVALLPLNLNRQKLKLIFLHEVTRGSVRKTNILCISLEEFNINGLNRCWL